MPFNEICTFGIFWHFYDAKCSIVTGQEHRLHFSDRNNNSETVSTMGTILPMSSPPPPLKHIAGAALRSYCGGTTSHYLRMLQQVEITDFAWMSEPSSSEDCLNSTCTVRSSLKSFSTRNILSLLQKTCPRNTDHTTPILSSSE